MPKRARPAYAGRLREAAARAGKTSEEISEEIDVAPSTIRGWWNDHSKPSGQDLAKYSAATGVSVWELQHGVGPLAHLARLIRGGLDPIPALEQMFADVPEALRQGPAWEISEADRVLLEGAGEAMRDELNRASGGKWDQLTVDQQEALLRLIAAMTPEDGPQES